MVTTNYSREQQESKSIALKVIQSRPVYLDTETTGLEKKDEIVEISIIEFDGSILLQSFVKPASPIPAEATSIHGITNSDVQKAPPWPFLWPTIRSLLYDRMIAAYNSPFDLRMMHQTHNRYRIPWRETFNWYDVMSLYSRFQNVWDPRRQSLRYFSLENAGKFFNIQLKNEHRASDDALLTRAVLHSSAGQPY